MEQRMDELRVKRGDWIITVTASGVRIMQQAKHAQDEPIEFCVSRDVWVELAEAVRDASTQFDRAVEFLDSEDPQ